jgi:hypothetical protein
MSQVICLMVLVLQPRDLTFYLRSAVGDRQSQPRIRGMSGWPDGQTALLRVNSPPRICKVQTICQMAKLLCVCRGSKFYSRSVDISAISINRGIPESGRAVTNIYRIGHWISNACHCVLNRTHIVAIISTCTLRDNNGLGWRAPGSRRPRQDIRVGLRPCSSR